MQLIPLNYKYGPHNDKQHGAALIISLIILLVMTVIGVTAMQVTVMQEKMAGNLRNKSVAFQAAESALRNAENSLTVAVLPSFDGTGGLYKATIPQKWKVIDWGVPANVAAYSGGNLGTGTVIANAPTYIIEELKPVLGGGGSLEAGIPQQTDFFRITSRAVGGNTSAVVMLQSVYKR